MGNIDTKESRAAREAAERGRREANVARYNEKMGILPVLRNKKRPGGWELCNSEEVLRNREEVLCNNENKLHNKVEVKAGKWKRDAAWWREYRKRVKVCPHCGKEIGKKG